MTNTETLLEEARTEVNNVSPNYRSLYVHLLGLRQLYQEKEAPYKAALENHPWPLPLELGACINHTFCESRSASEFMNIRAALQYVESLPEAHEAESILRPLADRVRELEQTLHAEQSAIAAAAAAKQAAIEEAKAAALAEVEARFAKPEPAAPAEPAKPFRGKVRLEEPALP
jgi:hypothetical protein